MPVSADTLARARKLRTSAVTELLADRYPLVHRLAHGLLGRVEPARRLVYAVMGRSIRYIPAWKDPTQAEHWFARYTILMARRTKSPPDGRQDLFLEDGKLVDAGYQAFIRALRSLPAQQQEAIVLHYCENEETRGVAVAMDCSKDAAATHLQAAQTQLQTVAGELFDRFVKRLAAFYQALTPSEQLILPNVHYIVRTRIWPRKLARAIAWLMLLGVIGAAVWGVYRIYPLIEI
jgi:DNA-directed RNA polymerase specialized sigma24 family protein